MSKIKILDCTLRDGGYINGWNFGEKNIRRIINYLNDANIDIIECGFLRRKEEYSANKSVFDSCDRLENYIPKKTKAKYVCMIKYGEYSIDDIPNYKKYCIDGIRVTFHKHDADDAIDFCEKLSKKGYMVFVQPLVTINYTDLELIKLVEKVNQINPYALSIVDSFGVMKRNDLLRMFYLIDNNLISNINIGYHSHNNLQLSYSNAQALVEINTNRIIVIDSSVYGMGRGSGNLNTELFVQYINEYVNNKYNVYPLLQIIDQVLINIYVEHYWGYSLPHYLSAVCNCHPNYANYLSEKNTLTIESINKILSKIPMDKKIEFDRLYIENIYKDFQKNYIDDEKNIQDLSNILTQKNILILAPGNSLEKYYEVINDFISKNNTILIGINHIYEKIKCDYTFISNSKRFNQLIENKKIDFKWSNIIITSNINTDNNCVIKVDYENLLNNVSIVADNSTLMFLKLLIRVKVKKVYLAGFDGYSYDSSKNYADKDMIMNRSNEDIKKLNVEITKFLNSISKYIDLEFITPTKYNNLEYLNYDSKL